MAKNIEIYKLGVVLNVDGAKGLSTLKAADSELTKVDKSGKKAEGTLGKVAGALNRVSSALKGNAGGAGSGGFLPGLANISNIIQGLPQIGQLAGALIRPLTDAAQAGVQFNAFLETTEIAMKRHFGGSRDEARKFIGEVRDFAGKSPFRTEGLIKTVIYGTATGFSPREALKLVQDVGDAIASTGDISEETVEGVVRALSQMKAKGRVSAEEMEQLAERGIPAWEMLAHAIGKTVAETRKASEQGKLDGPASVAALRAEMRARYGGMMDELQSTLTGRISALADATQAAEAKATESITKDISETIGAGLKRAGLVDSLAGTINSAIAPVSGLVRGAAVSLLGGGITSGLAAGISAGKGLVTQTVADFALDSVISPFKRLLGINSPSLVYAKFGADMVDGLAFGSGGSGGLASAESKEKLRRALEELLKDPRVQAMLDVIGKGEGTFNSKTGKRSYNKMFAGHRFELGSGEGAFRRTPFFNPKTGKMDISTATGFGQFIRPTWKGVSNMLGGLNIGSPRDQELAILALMHQEGMIGPLMRGDVRTAIARGSDQWASLPGSNSKQPQQKLSSALSLYDSRLGVHQNGFTVNNSPVSSTNPVPVTVISGLAGSSFNPGAAAGVVARAQREQAELLPVINRGMSDYLALLPPVNTELPVLRQATAQLTQATQRQELAAGHAAASVLQLGKNAESAGQRMLGAFSQIAGMLPQQQVGKKRGFLSKMLGFAAPFLGLIPGVGPILSTLATIGSNAAGGNWGGVVSGVAGGFASGGVFRGSGNSSAPAGVPVNFTNPATGLPGRERGGPVRRGRAYVVGEVRSEVFEPDEDGWIHPSEEAYRRSRAGRAGAGAGAGGGPQGGGNAWRAMIERLTAQLERMESRPPGDWLRMASQQNPGAITDGFMRHGSQDPRVVDWMTRRMTGQ